MRPESLTFHRKLSLSDSIFRPEQTLEISPTISLIDNPHTGSPQALELIRHWLDTCQEHHEDCPKMKEPPELPTRIIDVGPQDGSEEPFLYLPSGTCGHFVTLSHCWGGKQPITTTRSSLPDRQAGIPLSTLPRTFAESVSVVRRLGFRFLWIDSLCILQDSVDDWEAESPKMGDYYWNSAFTILAADSTDSSQGLFRERDGASMYPCVTEIRCKRVTGKKSVTASISPRMEKGWDWRRDESFPLETRGWTLQESILPARLVIFGRFQIEFLCPRMGASESCLLGTSNTWDVGGSHSQLQQVLWSGQAKDHGQGSVGLSLTNELQNGKDYEDPRYQAWRKMVEEYTRRELTVESDTLPAISGLASRFNRLLDGDTDEYLAGIWKRDLLQGLLWYVEGSSAHRPRKSWVGPTWSWTSIRQHQGMRHWSYMKDVASLMPTVLSASTRVNGLNPYGEVATGDLRLRCNIKAAMSNYDLESLDNYFDLLDPKTSCRVGTGKLDVVAEFEQYAIHTVYCAVMMKESLLGRDRAPSYLEGDATCILLIACREGDVSTYRRVGLGWMDWCWLEGSPQKEITIV